MALVIGAAAALVTSLSSSAQAASGTFFHTRADTGRETFLGSTPNGVCVPVSGGARSVLNDTDTDANLYSDGNCRSFIGFVGSRQSDDFVAPSRTLLNSGSARGALAGHRYIGLDAVVEALHAARRGMQLRNKSLATRLGNSAMLKLVESAWGAVPGLLPVRFPRPLAEPAVP